MIRGEDLDRTIGPEKNGEQRGDSARPHAIWVGRLQQCALCSVHQGRKAWSTYAPGYLVARLRARAVQFAFQLSFRAICCSAFSFFDTHAFHHSSPIL